MAEQRNPYEGEEADIRMTNSSDKINKVHIWTYILQTNALLSNYHFPHSGKPVTSF